MIGNRLTNSLLGFAAMATIMVSASCVEPPPGLGSSSDLQWIGMTNPGLTALNELREQGDAPRTVPNASFGVVSAADSGNEPAGFTRLTEHFFNSIEEDGWKYDDDPDGDLVIQSDRTAPHSPSSVGVAIFPAGFPARGTDPFSLSRGGWSAREVYVSFWFKLSPNWRGHESHVNKIFYLTESGGNPIYFDAVGLNDFRFRITTQGSYGQTHYEWDGSNSGQPNETPVLSSSARLIPGIWYRIEVLVKANTPGISDGELHAWINHTKILQYSRLLFMDPSGDGKLNNLRWEPIWGGIGTHPVPETMYQYIDHIYMSTAN